MNITWTSRCVPWRSRSWLSSASRSRRSWTILASSGSSEEGVAAVEPFRIHVTDEALDDLRSRMRRTRWPDQIAGIGWKMGTELEWLQHLVSYWTPEFDWRAWEKRLNVFDHFTWEGIHFVHRRAASGR